MSPNLNPFEHVGNMGKLQNLKRQPTNLQQLEIVLQQIWHKVSQATIGACINMRQRFEEIIQNANLGNDCYL